MAWMKTRPILLPPVIWLYVLYVIIFLLIGGCQSAPELPDLPWVSVEPEPDAQVIELSLLVWPETDTFSQLQALIEAFEVNHPDIDVQLAVSPDPIADLGRATAERPLDLVLIDAFSFPALIADEMLALPGAPLEGVEDVYPHLLEAFRHQGSLYCLPREVRTLALVYNQDAFQKVGLSPPQNWDEVRSHAEQLTDLNTGSFGLIVAPDLTRWLPFLYAAGGGLTDASGLITLDTPAALTALEFYLSLFRENFAGQPAESHSIWAGEVLGKGKGSMAIEGNWIIPYFTDEFPEFAYGVAPLPAGSQGRRSLAFSSCYAISATSRHPEAALALANYLTSQTAMQQLVSAGFMPTRLSLREAWLTAFPEMQPFMEAVDTAIVWQLPPGSETFLRTFNRRMVDLFAADIEAADLLQEVQQVGELIIKK